MFPNLKTFNEFCRGYFRISKPSKQFAGAFSESENVQNSLQETKVKSKNAPAILIVSIPKLEHLLQFVLELSGNKIFIHGNERNIFRSSINNKQ
jgi:hypothetical protein